MGATNSAGSFAAGVSRALRDQGFRPLPSGTSRMREGIRVGRSHSPDMASVTVDLDTPGAARRLADDVAEALAAAGYTVSRSAEATVMQVAR